MRGSRSSTLVIDWAEDFRTLCERQDKTIKIFTLAGQQIQDS